MATILISGGTGLVGKHLCKKLKEKGYDVAVLSRTKKQHADIRTYLWDVNKNEMETAAIQTADYIIHLAGENIGDKRWTTARQQLIIDSRVKTGVLLYEKVKESKHPLKAFISASAVGYYGALTTDKIFTETDPPAHDFLGTTCQQWEQTTNRFSTLGIRTVTIRTGVVLTKQGGALARLKAPFAMGMGAVIGDGKQYLPWIHIDDLCGIYIKAIEDTQMNGVYNAVSPDHKTYRAFIRSLARTLKRPIWLPDVPATAIKVILGKMADMVLYGSRVSSEKIKAAGYEFVYPELEGALKELTH